jgi:hypothetical protein
MANISHLRALTLPSGPRCTKKEIITGESSKYAVVYDAVNKRWRSS